MNKLISVGADKKVLLTLEVIHCRLCSFVCNWKSINNMTKLVDTEELYYAWLMAGGKVEIMLILNANQIQLT